MTDNLVIEIVKSIPPITRFMAAITLSICFLVYAEALSPYKLTFSKRCLLRMEIHRVFTSFFYFGSPSLDTVLHIVFLVRYSKMLEESFINMSDYAYFLVIVQGLVFLTALVWDIIVLGPVFSSVITYVWTRKNPSVQIQVFGCFVFPAFYLPFVLPLFSLVSEKKILKNEIIGIFVGHFYYFFKFVFPKFGYDPLKTPVFLQKVFGEYDERKMSNRMAVSKGRKKEGVPMKKSEKSEDTNMPNSVVLESDAQPCEMQAEDKGAEDAEPCEHTISYEIESSTVSKEAQHGLGQASDPESEQYWELDMPDDNSVDEDESSGGLVQESSVN